MGWKTWKLPEIAKGTLTWFPPLNAWRKRHLTTGGTDNPRYCYSVWLRHLVTLAECGFDVKGSQIGELGPGDSIGTGLAALLSGAGYYVGLDVVPLSAARNVETIFEELVELYRRKATIPDHFEFPKVRPRIKSYEFPEELVDCKGLDDKVERVRTEIKEGLQKSQMVRYCAPWTSIADVKAGSLDLIFSQAVLQYAVPPEITYRAMWAWLKEGQYGSHVIDLSAHYLSPFWNGHWAYSDWEWRLARGRRESFLSREPSSAHVNWAKNVGFEVLFLDKNRRTDGLLTSELQPRFQALDGEDLETAAMTMVLRKG